MIPFNKPAFTGTEENHIRNLVRLQSKLSGDGEYTKKCEKWFEKNLNVRRTLLTPSCTHALEMSAILAEIQAGDEVILPSYTFVSTANAFVLRGAKIKFIDIREDTLNLDESKLESAINKKTKVIVPVHYAGVSCEMDSICEIAGEKIMVVEDAAQGVKSFYNNRPLGSIGAMGCFSFHETKNFTSGGEGGLLLVNNGSLVERAEIIREKGTNRSKFFRGMVDKYSWVDVGSSYLASELQAAYLLGQLDSIDEIHNRRIEIWEQYHLAFKDLEAKEFLRRPIVPKNCQHNAHMYYLILRDLDQRERFIDFLKTNGIMSVFHYVPLHTSEAGKKFGEFVGVDQNTTRLSEQIVRLPLYYSLTQKDQEKVINCVRQFFGSES